MEIGMVMFFHVRRGFGRIRLDTAPEGVFAHYSDVSHDAKILLPEELVQFDIEETDKGPRARRIRRLGQRMEGTIQEFGQGHGSIVVPDEAKAYSFFHGDQIGPSYRQPEAGHKVEFSPFYENGQWQAKEVIISDPRSAWEKFAWLGNWQSHLDALASLARPEDWHSIEPKSSPYAVLDNYLKQYFRRIEQEGKIISHTEPDGKRWMLWDTGLRTAFGERIYARCSPNRKRYRADSYLARPRWVLRDFIAESAYLLGHVVHKPQAANFFSEPERVLYDPQRNWTCDYTHILAERSGRLPESWRGLAPAEQRQRLEQGLDLARRAVEENYRLAIPQYYQGKLQLLVPLMLEAGRPAMAFVLAQSGQMYRVNTILPLAWAYQNARLIAPLEGTWLEGSNQADPKTPTQRVATL